jgi:hypothetical protein
MIGDETQRPGSSVSIVGARVVSRGTGGVCRALCAIIAAVRYPLESPPSTMPRALKPQPVLLRSSPAPLNAAWYAAADVLLGRDMGGAGFKWCLRHGASVVLIYLHDIR